MELKKDPTRCDVAICGGGLGGLALAAALVRNGYDVLIFEAAAEWTTASILLGFTPSAFVPLDLLQLDVVTQLKALGCLSQASTSYVRADKASEMAVTRTPPMPGLITARWSVVRDLLASLVPPEVVHHGYQATGYTEDADSGVVRLHFKDKPDVEARLAVAADGIYSSLRATMVPNDPGPRYLGHMNWSAEIHNPQGSVMEVHTPGEMQVHTNQPFGGAIQWTLSSYLVDAGGDHTFWHVRVESPEPSFTPGPACLEPQPHAGGEGMGKPGSKARVEQLLTEAGLDHILKAVQATPESCICESALLDRVPLDELGATMSSPGGRVVLLGDAAHAMHVGLGQGARTAFEDAATLMTLLEQQRQELVQQGWVCAAGTEAAAEGKSCDSCTTAGSRGTQAPTASTPVQAGVSKVAGDREALSKVLAGYNEARLVRMCRVQRFAAEGCGLPAMRQALRPPGLDPAQMMTRRIEWARWFSQFPGNPSGDPASQFWQP